ncbi:MAG TPA: PEP-CTERM sorting domain-containing protein [Casimicrobiaceae bacterium]|nr:PEP-CTERM sorting domain-containing protein [Casimicrobiaceae bacterium]
MRAISAALGVASFLVVSSAFADYSFSFTSRVRHDAGGGASGAGAWSAGEGGSGGLLADDGGAGSDEGGGFGSFGAGTGLFGRPASGLGGDQASTDDCADPILSATDPECTMAGPTSARGGRLNDSGPHPGSGGQGGGGGAGTPPGGGFPGGGFPGGPGGGFTGGGSSGGGSSGGGFPGGGFTPGNSSSSLPGGHHDSGGTGPSFPGKTIGGQPGDPWSWPPIAPGNSGNNPINEDPIYGVGIIDTPGGNPFGQDGTQPSFVVADFVAPAVPEPGTLVLVGLALVGLAIVPLRSRH